MEKDLESDYRSCTNRALEVLVGATSPAAHEFTAYSVAVVALAQGRRALLIASTGLLGGVSRRMVEAVEAEFGCCPPLNGSYVLSASNEWEESDPERQIVQFIGAATGSFADCRIVCIGATWPICESCAALLQGEGLSVEGKFALGAAAS